MGPWSASSCLRILLTGVFRWILLSGVNVNGLFATHADLLCDPRAAGDPAVVDVRADQADAPRPPGRLAAGREQPLSRAAAPRRSGPRDGAADGRRSASSDRIRDHAGWSGRARGLAADTVI